MLLAELLKPQLRQFCKVTVPAAVSLALTLPLVACKVKLDAFKLTGEPLLPTEPLVLTKTTEPPVIPVPLVAMLPLAAVPPVACRKNVPVGLTVDDITVTGELLLLLASARKAEPDDALITRVGLFTFNGLLKLVPMF